MYEKKHLIFFLCLIIAQNVFSQQLPDNSYKPKIKNPAYMAGEGPIVYIDEAHNNFHTMNGRYRAFANVLEQDGYVVKRFRSKVSHSKLEQVKILVISNALNIGNQRNSTPPSQSAFTNEEIEAIKEWVMQGGSLFLIADHMPFAGAAAALANAFGFKFSNGFAMKKKRSGHSIFSVKNGTLVESIVIRGRDKTERVSEIATFTGQAFLIPKEAQPILVFDDDHINLFPERAWQFRNDTKALETKGWCQGAYMKFGQGRIVVSGEAAMFTSQINGRSGKTTGMSTEPARQNYKLLLNLIHWLDGLLNEEIAVVPYFSEQTNLAAHLK